MSSIFSILLYEMAVIGLGVTEGSQTDLLKVLWSGVFLCRALSFDGDRTKSIPAEKALAEVDYPSHSLHWRILAIPFAHPFGWKNIMQLPKR
jgi:hypothetical protein